MRESDNKRVFKLRHLERLEIAGDGADEKIYHGYDQEWFRSYWQRLSGCGPTTASNLLRYLWRSRPGHESDRLPPAREEALQFQEQVWRLVTPSRRGMPTVKRFYTGLMGYANSVGWPLECHHLEVPPEAEARRANGELAEFLTGALGRDLPVAFLNLCVGDEEILDEWHWVTLVGVELRGEEIFGNILDNGEFSTANLSLWHRTTTRGGGFAYFRTVEEREEE